MAKKRDSKWIYVTLPGQIAAGPVATLVTLYILHLGGSIMDVSYAMTIGNAVIIPASFFWGRITDMLNRRKVQILLSYVALALSLLGFYYTKSILGVILLYGFFIFATAANGTPLTLMVMENYPKHKWSSVFSRLQMVSGVGATVGFVIAAIVTNFVSLDLLLLVLMTAAIAAVVLTARLVREPSQSAKEETLLDGSIYMVTRVIIAPFAMLLTTKTSTIMNMINIGAVRHWKENYVSVIYAASFVFFLGTGLFNTMYPAGLSQVGLGDKAVFLVLFVGLLVQTVVFNFAGRFMENRPRMHIIHQSVKLRGVCYALIGVTFVALSYGEGSGAGMVGFFLAANMVLYLMAAGLAFSLYYATSYAMIFETINNMDRGKALGVYAAIIGIGVLLGSLLSGYTSEYIGYWFTFALAGVLVVASGQMFKYAHKN